MIRSHEDFDTTLEEATRLLSAAPADGTPEHARLLSLMRDIAAYRPAVVLDAAEPESEAERLSKRLDTFESRLPPHFSSHWHSMIGGDLSGSNP
jgi:hypothetical protein